MFIRSMLAAVAIGLATHSVSAQTAAVAIPPELSRAGDEIAGIVKAEGVLTYECYRAAGDSYWMFLGPRMVMKIDGAVVGRIQRGPVWQHNDGSSLTGKAVAEVPGKTEKDLKLQRFETESKGNGLFSGVNAVVQIDTVEGTIAAGGCKEHGMIVGAPFWATYVLLKAK